MPARGLRLLATAFTPDQFPPAGAPEVVVVGRSNVGKSSLLNRLAGQTPRPSARDGARISSRPGCTRSVNFYAWRDGVVFVDLPGYGYACLSRNRRQDLEKLVAAYFRGGRPTAALLHVVDARHPMQTLDHALLNWSRPLGHLHLLALNKCDKLSRSLLAARRREATAVLSRSGRAGEPWPVSALTGEGVGALAGRLLALVTSPSKGAVLDV